MTSKSQRAQDLLVLKHSILLQQLETKYMEHVNALLTQKTKLMVALQSAYHQQMEELESMERDQSRGGSVTASTASNPPTEKGQIGSIQDVLSGITSNLNGSALSTFDELQQFIASSGLDNFGGANNHGLGASGTPNANSSDWTVLESILSNVVQDSGSSSNRLSGANCNFLSQSQESTASTLSTQRHNDRHGMKAVDIANTPSTTTLSMPEIDVEALQHLVLPNIEDLIRSQPELPPIVPNGKSGLEIDRSPNEPRKSLNHKKVGYHPPPNFPISASSSSSVSSSTSISRSDSTTTTPNGLHRTQSPNGTRKRSRAVMEDEVSSESEDGDVDGDGGHSDDDDAKDFDDGIVSAEQRKRARKRKRSKKGKRERGHSRKAKRRRQLQLSESESASSSGENVEKLTCICRRPALGKMIKCANTVCKVGLYHVSCMRLFKGTPTLKWYCKSCRRYPSKSSIIKPEFKKFETQNGV